VHVSHARHTSHTSKNPKTSSLSKLSPCRFREAVTRLPRLPRPTNCVRLRHPNHTHRRPRTDTHTPHYCDYQPTNTSTRQLFALSCASCRLHLYTTLQYMKVPIQPSLPFICLVCTYFLNILSSLPSCFHITYLLLPFSYTMPPARRNYGHATCWARAMRLMRQHRSQEQRASHNLVSRLTMARARADEDPAARTARLRDARLRARTYRSATMDLIRSQRHELRMTATRQR
jgi:hypothetical protein